MTSDKDEAYEEIAAWLEYCQGNNRETAEILARKIIDEKEKGFPSQGTKKDE